VVYISQTVELSASLLSLASGAIHTPLSAYPHECSCQIAGCSHYNLTVESGKKYRLRLINAGSLAMQTFYVEGHNLTIVAADATPTDPISVSSVDVNLGQRSPQAQPLPLPFLLRPYHPLTAKENRPNR
jgi:hypothetical protein